MRNVQARDIAAPPERVGALLDRLAGPDDPLWPAPAWPPILLDRGLAVGSTGGHSRIRYRVTEYEPGHRIRFAFDPRIGLRGYHEFRVESDPGGCRLVHDGVATTHGPTRLAWPVAVRWLHEALIKDLLDNAESAATGTLRAPGRWSPWVRLLRRTLALRTSRVDPPAAATLARLAADDGDVWDARRLPVPAGLGPDADTWRATAPGTRLAVLARTADEVLTGDENADVRIRVSFHRDERGITVTSLARPLRWRGRPLLAAIRPFHPLVVRARLRRAARTLAATGRASPAVSPSRARASR
jgi:Polyketide cyclase / dehydrase and lipid transport/Protein of unknown function (DUF2867)